MPARRSRLPGLLLAQAAPGKVASWAARGVVPVHVVPQGRWCAVVPTGQSLAAPPYDDALTVLAARPVPGALRPALAFVAQPDEAVVAVHPRGSAVTRWLVWRPGRGALVLPAHQPAGPRDLLAAAGADPGLRDEVVALLRGREGTGVALLAALVDLLDLPGADLLTSGDAPDADGTREVVPATWRVERFDRDVAEEHEVRRDLEQQR